ncbi:hypothetical protein EXIGLDRAFT_782084 [Exidia glandulosa HHB12029]|uniref:Uncharacterized protein n=1 Tax=Exidia glandulosa HHB12029 TaxID=1314781 RepID=A0A165B0N5_EXIGL|nr:hypothetical protein EXIGLDRAFT_782084 [Exidia glandulosa HHB12029]
MPGSLADVESGKVARKFGQVRPALPLCSAPHDSTHSTCCTRVVQTPTFYLLLMDISNAKSAKTPGGGRGRNTAQSSAIIDWGYPKIFEYLKMRRDGRESEAKKYKKEQFEAFEKDEELSCAVDKVHGGMYKEMSKKEFLKDIKNWWNNSYNNADSLTGAFAKYCTRQQGGTTGAVVDASALVHAKPAFVLFAQDHSEEVEKLADQLQAEAGCDDGVSNGDEPRVKFWQQAAKDAFNNASTSDRDEYERKAAEMKETATRAKATPAGIAARRQQLREEFLALVRRLPTGQYGIGTVSVQMSFYDEATTEQENFSFGHGRYILGTQWHDESSSEGSHAYQEYKGVAKKYFKDCLDFEARRKARAFNKSSTEKPGDDASEEERRREVTAEGENGEEKDDEAGAEAEKEKRAEEDEVDAEEDGGAAKKRADLDAELEDDAEHPEKEKGDKEDGNDGEKSAEDMDMDTDIQVNGKKGGKGKKLTGLAKK